MSCALVRAAWGAAVLLFGAARESAAQTLEYGPAKIAAVHQRNAAGERIESLEIAIGPGDAYWALLGLGDGRNALGDFAEAEAFVHDDGTFWAKVEADNNDPMFRDTGNGEASTTLAYGMHKAKDVPGEVRLDITGGTLHLIDYGGGTAPLEAAVLVQVEIKEVDEEEGALDEFSAILTGRGGAVGAETFEWSSERFEIGAASYSESGSGENVFEAELEIPPQTVVYGLEYFCEECDFEFWVELSVIANNPGGETKAYAYFRDPVHVEDAEPELGGASVSWEGVTLREPPQRAPEPAAAAGGSVAFACVLLARRPGRFDRYTPAGSARPIMSSKFST